MKFHLGSPLGTGRIICTCSFPFYMVPLLQAFSSDGVNILWTTLKTSSGHSQPLCQPVHIFSAVQHLAADSLPHIRAKEGKMGSLFLSLKLRICSCYFFFRIPVKYLSNKQKTFVQQIDFSYKKMITLWISQSIFWERQIWFFWKENLLCSCSLFAEKNDLTGCRGDPFIDFFHSGEHETLDSARKTESEFLCMVQSS